MELRREGAASLPRPAQDAQAGSPGQIVFSGRIVLQNQRQGTPCVSAGGCRASIERQRPATPGRMQIPVKFAQQVAIPGVRSRDKNGTAVNADDLLEDELEIRPFGVSAAKYTWDIMSRKQLCVVPL